MKMTAKYINGELQFLDRAPAETFNSGSGVEFSVVNQASHADASVITIRSDNMKYVERATGKPANVKRIDLVDAFTTTDEGHQHGIRASIYNGALEIVVLYATNPTTGNNHDHQVVRDGDNFQCSISDGHSHLISGEALRSSLESAITRAKLDIVLETNRKSQETNPMTEVTDTAPSADEKRNDEIKDLKAQIERANKKADLNDEQRAHFNSLDEKGQDAFLDMTPEARAEAMKPADKSEAEVRADKLEAEVKELREANETAKYLTRAKEELTDIQGEDSDKAALLRAIDTLPEDQAKRVTEMVRGVSQIAKSVQTRRGTKVEGMDSVVAGDRTGTEARAELKERADKHENPDNLSRSKLERSIIDADPALKLDLARKD